MSSGETDQGDDLKNTIIKCDYTRLSMKYSSVSFQGSLCGSPEGLRGRNHESCWELLGHIDCVSEGLDMGVLGGDGGCGSKGEVRLGRRLG